MSHSRAKPILSFCTLTSKDFTSNDRKRQRFWPFVLINPLIFYEQIHFEQWHRQSTSNSVETSMLQKIFKQAHYYQSISSKSTISINHHLSKALQPIAWAEQHTKSRRFLCFGMKPRARKHWNYSAHAANFADCWRKAMTIAVAVVVLTRTFLSPDKKEVERAFWSTPKRSYWHRALSLNSLKLICSARHARTALGMPKDKCDEARLLKILQASLENETNQSKKTL